MLSVKTYLVVSDVGYQFNNCSLLNFKRLCLSVISCFGKYVISNTHDLLKTSHFQILKEH